MENMEDNRGKEGLKPEKIFKRGLAEMLVELRLCYCL
jgi:hypothetical protein